MFTFYSPPPHVVLTQNLLRRRQAEAGLVLQSGRRAAVPQRAHHLPEARHFLPQGLTVLLALLLGGGGGVHFEVEDSGLDGIVVALRRRDKERPDEAFLQPSLTRVES